MSPAGGYAVMATDEIEIADRVPLRMARLSESTLGLLRTIAPPFASVRNPVDLTTNATDDMVIRALNALLKDDGVDMVLCVAMFAPPGITDGLIRRIAGVDNEARKPVIVVCQFGPFTDGDIRRFYDLGIIGYPSVARGVRALRWLEERREIEGRG
jgi:acyl-CoA synthetase (NDP forming)